MAQQACQRPSSHSFISYAREDKKFVLQLREAFHAANRQAWVDEHDIGAAIVYRKAIEDAITAADAVVFVISPDSIASENCAVEIGWAEKHGKRLIPIRYRDVRAEDAPESIERLNWIPFSPDCDFQNSLRTLFETIDTDRDWVENHSRFETRASEWRASQEDRSRLLTGNDLRRAEEWLSRSSGQTPPHTELQAEFIAASRRAAIGHQRRLLAGVSTALVVAVVLGILALYGGIRSSRLSRQALSRQLAAQSSGLLEEQLDLALLLSVEACRAAPSMEAIGSLLTALQREPHLVAFLHGHTRSVNSLAFSPDGAFLVSGGADSAVIVWSLPDLEISQRHANAHRGALLSVAISPDGTSMASGGEDGATLIWNLRQPDQPPVALPEHLCPVNALCYAGDGKLLASVTDAGVLSLWDIERNGPSCVGQTTDGDPLECLQFTSDNQRLITGSEAGVVSVWNVGGCSLINSQRTGRAAAVVTLACDVRGSRIVTGCGDGIIQIWELGTLTPLGAPLSDPGTRVAALALSRDGTRLASTGTEAALICWDTDAGVPIWKSKYGLAGEYRSLALDPSERLIATGTGNGTILLWKTDSSLPLCKSAEPLSSWIRAEALAADGSLQALATEDTVVVIRSLVNDAAAPISIIGRAPVSAAALSPMRRMAATGEEDGVIRLWELGSRRLISEHPLESADRLQTITFAPRGRYLAADGGSEYVYLLRVDDPAAAVTQLVGCIDEATALAFSADGELLVAGDRRGQLIIWRAGNPQPLRGPLLEHRAAVTDLAFSHRGHRLASVDVSGEVLVWDTEAWRPIRRLGLTREAGIVTSVAFSRDDAMIATGGWDGTVRLWSATDLSPIGLPLQGHHGPVADLVFAADGGKLVSVGNDGETLQWNLGIENLSTCARRIANRDLTPSEWTRYFGYAPFRPSRAGTRSRR